MNSQPPESAHPENHAEVPELRRDPAFWGMTVAQFLGAFNDNVFKQILLLMAIAQPTAVALAAGKKIQSVDNQWLPLLIFALPFLIFSGYAGFLSDRYSKRLIVVLSKAAEIVVMLLGLGAFLFYQQLGYNGLLVVLFLMSAQSAFFGPSKYGILPELLHERDLPRANGIFLMTTFLAIIFGQVTAGILKEHFEHALWIASAVCVAMAVAGTLASLLVRRTPPAEPALEFSYSALLITKDMFQSLLKDRRMLVALLVYSMFWTVAGLAVPAVNSLGKVQLELADGQTSAMQGAIGIGIMFGCLLAGYWSQERVSFRIMNYGAWGILITFGLLALWKPGGDQALGYYGSLPVLALLGGATGLFAVPIQVFLQSRPAESQKGRMIAAMNQVNWIGIILSSLIYKGLDALVNWLELPRCAIFACLAIFMLPVAILYRPADEELSAKVRL